MKTKLIKYLTCLYILFIQVAPGYSQSLTSEFETVSGAESSLYPQFKAIAEQFIIAAFGIQAAVMIIHVARGTSKSKKSVIQFIIGMVIYGLIWAIL